MNTSSSPALPILLVDDEIDALENAALVLLSGGMGNVIRCYDSRRVMELLSEGEIGTILLDLTMPYKSGEKVLLDSWNEVKELYVTGEGEKYSGRVR